MSLQFAEILDVNIFFDKDKTKNHRTQFNKPCDCQACRNFYENIKRNVEAVEFLSNFGLDYDCTEEVFSWDLGDDKDSLIHSKGYYGVFGKIEGAEFDFEKFDVKIIFSKEKSIPTDRTGEYFWICIENCFPYILDEQRDLPITFSKKIQRIRIVDKLKTIFKKAPR